jgi:WD40 repeat protein
MDTLDTLADAKMEVSNSQRFPQNSVNERIIYTPDGKSIVAWSTRKSGVAVWDVERRTLRYPRLHVDLPPLAGASLSPDGRLLAMALGHTAAVEILELETGRILDKRFEHPAFVHHVQFSPDGQRIVTSCRDGYARVIDWQTGIVERDRLAHDGDVINACFTHDGQNVLTIGLDDMLRVWHGDDGNIALRPIPIPAGSSQILVRPDSKRVVIAGGQLRVVDLEDLHRSPELTLEQAQQTSEILAAKAIVDGVTQTMSSSEWLARWRSWSRD